MKDIKKTIAFLLIFTLIPSFSACKANTPQGEIPDTSVTAPQVSVGPSTEPNASTDPVESKATEEERSVLLDVPFQDQAEFPCGCESACAVMALSYAGAEITLRDFIENLLPCEDSFRLIGAEVYGPDPEKTFAGHPAKSDSFGCFPPVIAEAVRRSGREDLFTWEPEGVALPDLCEGFVRKGIPVLVWASVNMEEFVHEIHWRLYGTGKLYEWTGREHCLLLTGFDEENYYFNDPLAGKDTAYPRALAERRFDELGRRSLVIARDDPELFSARSSRFLLEKN